MANPKVITQPAYEPVTLAEAKLWLRVDEDDTEQDAMINLLIIAMREYAESLTGRAFVQRTLEHRLDKFPQDAGVIELPVAPLRSVTSIQYVDGDGVLQSIDSSPTGWQEDTFSEPGKIKPLTTSNDWPITLDELGAVRIRYVSGYANPNSIPKKVRLWMQTRISTLYEHREQIVIGGVVNIPRAFVDGLLDDLKVHKNFA
jgi:uncharacterized phiE125 gp8 family phage protein